ncbi:elongation factor 1-beta [archaeon]|jgi:elongation factor 1-beta|nr:elongation factor 1-beta [archaeon]MBT4022865.1 elongation factor 1-beta [archaeon]MBT4272512.1 elongation factor 1-beta [archaeon]MBT4460420.1 elongation factor 1-beta [archaeon]MBT4859051.1 elongation factor 1-beta [archaeon]
MADVVITMKIMPESPEVDLEQLTKLALEKITAYTELDNNKVEQEPMAFGLKALKIMFVMDEAKGDTDPLEKELNSIPHVASVEVTDVRRTIA